MITTSTYSFIRFDGSDDAIPYITGDNFAFQVVSDVNITSVRMVDMYGNTIEEVSDIIFDTGEVTFINPQFTQNTNCFRMILMSGSNIIAESNTFFNVLPNNHKFTSKIAYRNDEDSFGFSYCPGFIQNIVRLPFELKNPQFPQSQNVYIERNGRRRVTYVTIGKEYQLETDYMTEDSAERLLIALSHDTILIDGILLTKSGDYNLQWIETKNGRFAKATCTMSTNVTERNSNCGSVCSGAEFEVWPLSLQFAAS